MSAYSCKHKLVTVTINAVGLMCLDTSNLPVDFKNTKVTSLVKTPTL